MKNFKNEISNFKLRMLSIDGGGMRGIIPLVLLRYIEEYTEKPIHKLFNVIGGTSTGGIIALGLNTINDKTGKVFTAQEVLNFYIHDARKIFKRSSKLFSKYRLGSPKYESESIEGYLKEKFGANTRLNNLPIHNLVSVYSYDLVTHKQYKFSSDRSFADTDGLVWQAARATSAAPTYFPAFKYSDPHWCPEGKTETKILVDGAILLNNPAILVLLDGRRKMPGITSDEELLVSLGTGYFKTDISNLENSGFVRWGRKIFDEMSRATTAQTESLMDKILVRNIGVSTSMEVPIDGNSNILNISPLEKTYYRFQQSLNTDIDLDDTRPKIIDLLQQLGDKLVNDNITKITQLCNYLVESVELEENGNE